MKIITLIGIGSFLGGVSRYLLAQTIQSKFLSTYPFGTFTVNILGCLVIGIVIGFSNKFNLSPEWRLFLATGFCGGFTTFSSFSLETMAMLRQGQLLYSFTYLATSIIFGLIAVYLGMLLFKFL